jgi:hypothetical protein
MHESHSNGKDDPSGRAPHRQPGFTRADLINGMGILMQEGSPRVKNVLESG